MKTFNKKVLHNRGDTIVEVLIAIAIVSLVLAGAYTSTRHSANATRTAQEHGEATKIAESQVEQIKIASDTGTPDLSSATPPFCIAGAATPASSASACTSGLYNTSITVPATDEYVVKVTWAGLAASTNSVEMDYKVK